MVKLSLFLNLLIISSVMSRNFKRGKSKKVEAQRRIVGGNAVRSQNNFAYQVSVWKTKEKEYFCTGSIIGAKFVLSCAHCYEDVVTEPEEIFIKVGALNIYSPKAVIHKIKQIFLHKFYIDFLSKNDISLLVTTKPFSFNRQVKPIALATAFVPEGAFVTISGWGLDDVKGSKPLKNLMMVKRPKINLETCRNSVAIRKYQRITNNSFCTAVEGHRGTCRGDSGGPVTYKKKLVGVVTGGVNCAEQYPDIHLNVIMYEPWIKNVLKEAQKGRRK